MNNIEVFLGGTTNDSDWRDKLIPKLKIDYFNPVVDNWDDKSKKKEEYKKRTCEYLLYTITPKMKGVFSVYEVTNDAIERPEKTLFLFLKKDGDEKFDKEQLNSLETLGRRLRRKGVKWFESLSEVAEFLNNVNKIK